MIKYTPINYDAEISMETIGVFLIFIMPLLTGHTVREITKQKEANQIETYLIGFFFLFFMQGMIFTVCVFTNQTFAMAGKVLIGLYIVITILYLVLLGFRFIPAHKNKKSRQKMRKEEWILFGLMIVIFLLVLLRIFLGENVIRTDAMLETVKTTVDSGTMFQIHPLTGQVLESGYITSKKIVTLPLYYAFLSSVTHLAPAPLLYIVITAQTVTAAFLSSALLVGSIFQKNRKRIFAFEFTYGLLLLSGDYFIGTSSQRLLWNGYAGEVICALVMLPYLLYIVRNWYLVENSENPPTNLKRIMTILILAFCLVTSLFMTGIATGFLFLFMMLIILGICCLIKTIKEVKKCN